MSLIDYSKARFFVAVDTDVVIHLNLCANNDLDELSTETEYIKNNIKKLWQMVYDGDIKLYITPQVLFELGEKITQYTADMVSRSDAKIFSKLIKFVRTFCHPIYMDKRAEKVFQRAAKHLSDRYVLEAGFDGIVSEYADGEKFVFPSKDAKALAEASLCGLIFLTENTKDFIFDAPQGNNVFTKNKLINVERINNEEGLSFTSSNNWFKTPIPISLDYFLLRLPDCYMDEPFFPDTKYKTKPLTIDEIKRECQEDWRKFFGFMHAAEKLCQDPNKKVVSRAFCDPYTIDIVDVIQEPDEEK